MAVTLKNLGNPGGRFEAVKRKVRCFEITPHPETRYDSMIVRADKKGDEVLELIRQSMESQFARATRWKDIYLKLECVELTEEELRKIESSD